jgi:D-alanine-D-alanine ligase
MGFEPSSLTVAVLQGGVSAEREVSLLSGKNCAAALRKAGFSVCVYDAADLSFIEALRMSPPDVVFIALHGRFGEDGTIQGLLELLGLPYTGSGVLTSALAMDKKATKGIYAQAGLSMPSDEVITQDDIADIVKCDALCDRLVAAFGQDVVVKPNSEGSSVGVTIVHSRDRLPKALQDALELDTLALVEPFIPGLEIMAGVLGNAGSQAQALPLIEVESSGEFYDYDSKYAPGGSCHVMPARLSNTDTRQCQDLAVAAHNVLDCRGYSRSDIRFNPATGKAYLLETNTLPGMTSVSLIPEAARGIGIDFPELVTRLVRSALAK